MDNTQERNSELYAAYIKLMREVNITHSEAVHRAVNSPASRYYVSPNYLYREILRRERGEETPQRARTMRKTGIYDHLFSEYLSMKSRPIYNGLSKLALCDLVVNSPAPCFFLSDKRGDEIIRKVGQQRATDRHWDI